jgi:hypothetical protein
MIDDIVIFLHQYVLIDIGDVDTPYDVNQYIRDLPIPPSYLVQRDAVA